MKELIDELRAKAEAEGGQTWRAEALGHAAEPLESYLAACVPRTSSPTVDEFQRHAAKHGPWLRVSRAGVEAMMKYSLCSRCGRFKAAQLPYCYDCMLIVGGTFGNR